MDAAAVVSIVGAIASAVATIVLAFLTARYVRLTKALVDEARSTKQPNVYADVEFDDYDVRFVVGNSGPAPAIDVRIDVTDSIPWKKRGEFQQGFANVAPVKNGIAYLAPGRVLKYMVGIAEADSAFFAEGSAVQIRLRYLTETGTELKRDFVIELKSYNNVLLDSFKDPESEIAKAIRDSEWRRTSHDPIRSMINRMGKTPCPSCGELISSKAIKCPHCHEPVPAKPKEASS